MDLLDHHMDFIDFRMDFIDFPVGFLDKTQHVTQDTPEDTHQTTHTKDDKRQHNSRHTTLNTHQDTQHTTKDKRHPQRHTPNGTHNTTQDTKGTPTTNKLKQRTGPLACDFLVSKNKTAIPLSCDLGFADKVSRCWCCVCPSVQNVTARNGIVLAGLKDSTAPMV